ncbi:MAG: signal peptidase I [Christensenellales bacterium]
MQEKSKNVVKVIINVVLDIIIAFIVVVSGFFCYFKICYTEAVVIGPSMYPTLNAGEVDDVVAIKKGANFTYGDIVTAKSDRKDSEGNYISVIKRVIALEGDYVDVIYNDEDELIIKLNSEELDEPYIQNKATKQDNPVAYLNWQEYKSTVGSKYVEGQGLLLGKDEVFLMGDNRIVSNDSTIMGPFKINDVQGKVDFKFSKGENAFIQFMQQMIFNIK